MQVIKSLSAINFFKLSPEIRKKYFWGGKLWTQSFFIETIGNVNDEVIKKYVRNQLKKMDEAEEWSMQLKIGIYGANSPRFPLRWLKDTIFSVSYKVFML